MKPDERVVCPECGGIAHLILELPEDVELEPDDFAAYRCEDCGRRWDVQLGETENADD